MQKKSQKLQSLQDKKKYLKDAGDCEEEMRMLHEENEERQARFQARFQARLRHCLRSRAVVERKQIFWKKKSRLCKQERKEEAAVRHCPMGVAIIQPLWGSSSRLDQHRLSNSSPSFMEKSAVYGGQHQQEPPAPELVAGGEEKRRVGRRLGQGEGGK